MTPSFLQPDGVPANGDRSADTGHDPLDAAALEAAGFGTVRHLVETGSTMDEARQLAADTGIALPAIVVADRQAAGRGRRGAGWWQPPGSLAASLVLAGPGHATPPPTWSLACGVALAETLAALVPTSDPRVRWPNDVEIGGRKLAGILVEATVGGRVIVGIGVNTTGHAAAAPTRLRQRLVTLPDLGSGFLSRTRLLSAFLPRLLDVLAALADDPGTLAARYRPRCSLTGQAVTIHLGGTACHGICHGVGADGALLLETPDGLRRFMSGSLTAPANVWHGET